jgi:hypothetical protein
MVFPRSYLPPRSAASRGSHDNLISPLTPAILWRRVRPPAGGEARAAQSIRLSDVTLHPAIAVCYERRF